MALVITKNNGKTTVKDTSTGKTVTSGTKNNTTANRGTASGQSTTVSYDKNTDYTALRDAAAARGDYTSAAIYEQQRNQKINDLNASGTNQWNAQVSNQYAQYLPGPVNNGQTPSYAGSYRPADPNGVGNAYADTMVSMSTADRNALTQYGQDYNRYAAQEEQALANAVTDADKAAIREQYAALKNQAHQNAQAIRAKYGYSGGDDGSEFLAFSQYISGGGGGGSSGIPLLTNRAPDLTGTLNNWLETSKAQQEEKINYAVQQGILALQRAEEDAQMQFQTQQNQVDINEARALDNQALYAEARGDRGGIGQAQYAQIQATAMTNRRAINTARTQLSTDTARQITDLRAQGEFEKADALLELTQNYLTQLIDLEKWGAEFNLDVDKFNTQIRQWQAEYELEVGKLLGTFNGQPTLDSQKEQNDQLWQEKEWEQNEKEWEQKQQELAQKEQEKKEEQLYQQEQDALSAEEKRRKILASAGAAALKVGVRPTAEQQEAMGYTDAQIDAAIQAYRDSKNKKTSSSGSTSLTTQKRKALAEAGEAALKVGVRPSAAQQSAMGYTDAQIERALELYRQEQEKLKIDN